MVHFLRIFAVLYHASVFLIVEVDSFASLRAASRTGSIGTINAPCSNLLAVASRNRATIKSNAMRQCVLFATPQTKSEERTLRNETSLNFEIASEQVGIELIADTSQPKNEESLTESQKPDILSAAVIGPILSIVGLITFLVVYLLQNGQIADDYETMNLAEKLTTLSKISWFPSQFQEAEFTVGLVMAFSSFAQALTGFGFAVVAVGMMSSMPWLLHSELYDVITPVAATLGALVGFILLIPYAFATPSEDEPGLEWNEILPLLIPCTVLTPVGIKLNSMVDPIVATRLLAALIMGFVGYKLLPIIQEKFGGESDDVSAESDDSAPEFLKSKTAAIVFGSAAGVFGGAFDVQGPPLCVYGDAKGWSPAQFRNNVLTVVALNSASVVALNAFQGTLGDFYYAYFCITSLPGVLLGIVAGEWASERIDPVLFKNIVLIMCLGLGLQLLTIS